MAPREYQSSDDASRCADPLICLLIWICVRNPTVREGAEPQVAPSLTVGFPARSGATYQLALQVTSIFGTSSGHERETTTANSDDRASRAMICCKPLTRHLVTKTAKQPSNQQ